MERISKEFYRFPPLKKTKEGDVVRLWHDCKKYITAETARVEMKFDKAKDDQLFFVCEYCGRTKTIDL